MARLNPVRIPNIAQNTPSYDDLCKVIESEKPVDIPLSVEEQLALLKAQYAQELDSLRQSDAKIFKKFDRDDVSLLDAALFADFSK